MYSKSSYVPILLYVHVYAQKRIHTSLQVHTALHKTSEFPSFVFNLGHVCAFAYSNLMDYCMRIAIQADINGLPVATARKA